MSFYISICEDLDALKATGLVDEDSPLRGMINGRSGNYICYSPDGTKSMAILSDTTGLEEIADLAYVSVTSPEELFGFKTQAVNEDGELLWTDRYIVTPEPYEVSQDNWVDTGTEDDNGFSVYENQAVTEIITPDPYETHDPIMEETLGDSVLRALYDSIYDQTPVTDEDGNTTTPSQFFALPSGYDPINLL